MITERYENVLLPFEKFSRIKFCLFLFQTAAIIIHAHNNFVYDKAFFIKIFFAFCRKTY